MKYDTLSADLVERIKSDRENGTMPDFAAKDGDAVRRSDTQKDRATIWRPNYVRDVDKIMHSAYYNRYADKTQVFSFFKNDDITRRALHVQLVSRIARTIGSALNLNLDLIEAIALGHDIGHTPFGHAGEGFLDELYHSNTGRRFSHNIHSVRVLDKIFPLNISLQTLSGIAAHDGEFELAEYYPKPFEDFKGFDTVIEECYLDKSNVKKLVPSTLEGCVMRISDIIAYLGKDRQDADKADVANQKDFSESKIGTINAEIINNLIVNIIENSYGKPYIKMDEEHFKALSAAKAANYDLIYKNEAVDTTLKTTVKPMMEQIYKKLLFDLKKGDESSPIFKHHISFLQKIHYKGETPYAKTESNQIVVDYIASMTDDYFIDLHAHLFPESKFKIEYKGYFDKL